MLNKEIIAVCSAILSKHRNTLCEQNVGFLNVKLDGMQIGQFLNFLLSYTHDYHKDQESKLHMAVSHNVFTQRKRHGY
jgi:hypothetical protein